MIAQTNDRKGSRVMYGESTGPYQVDRDSSELPSTNVVLSITAIEGVRPTQLPSLAQTIDPDALETVFGCSEDATLSFSCAGYRVTLDVLDSIEVVPVGDSQPLQ